MLTDKLQQLQTEGQPQSMDELFNQSKEGMMVERIQNAVNALIPQMKQDIANEVRNTLTDEIKAQIGAIKVRDGRDANENRIVSEVLSKIPKPKDGTDGKSVDKKEIIDEIMAKIPPLALNRKGGKGGGGSTIRVDNLSSQITGSTRSFTTNHKIGASHLLFYSSFPSLFLPTTDYSASGNVITLNSSIPYPDAGQSLAIIYESMD